MSSLKRNSDSDDLQTKKKPDHGIVYEFELTEKKNYEERSVIDISGTVRCGGEEVGSLEAYLFLRKKKTMGWYSKCDALSSETQECAVVFFKDDGTLQPAFATKVSAHCNSGGLLHIISVKINEGHRGKDLGVTLVKNLLDDFVGRWTLAMMQPYPLRCDEGEGAFDAAIVRISRYFSRLGFKQCGDNAFSSDIKFWYLDATQYSGVLLDRAATRELTVVVPASEPPKTESTKQIAELIQHAPEDVPPELQTVVGARHTLEVGAIVSQLRALQLQGGDINAANALQFAVANKKVYLVDILIEQGANVNSQDHAGNTALHLAAATMNAQAITKLLECGADKTIVDKENNTPLKTMKNVRKSLAQFRTTFGLPSQPDTSAACVQLLR